MLTSKRKHLFSLKFHKHIQFKYYEYVRCTLCIQYIEGCIYVIISDDGNVLVRGTKHKYCKILVQNSYLVTSHAHAYPQDHPFILCISWVLHTSIEQQA